MSDLIPRPNTTRVSHFTDNMELLVIAHRIRQRTAEFAYQTGLDLIEAKATCAHGEWILFLNLVEIPPRAAQRMMRFARLRDLRPYRRIRELPFSEFLKLAPVVEKLHAAEQELAMLKWKTAELEALNAGMARRCVAMEKERAELEGR